MNAETGLWTCHSCHERGNVVSFVSKVQGVPYAMAATWLREAYGVDFREPEDGSMLAEIDGQFAEMVDPPSLRRPDESWVEAFMADLYSDVGSRAYEYIAGRGFSPETISSCSLGYDAISDRLVVPVWDLDAGLVGFKGRALHEHQEPKFLILGDRRMSSYLFDPYESSQTVFGLERARDHDQVVLVESELDAVALRQMGVERPAAIGMSYLTEHHARLLVQECREVVTFFDSDRAGEEGLYGHVGADGSRLRGALDRLLPHVVVRVVEQHDRDPAKMLQDGDEDLALEMIERARPAVAGSIALQ